MESDGQRNRSLGIDHGDTKGWGQAVGGNHRLAARKARWGYVFILPWIAGLVVFIGGPIVACLYLSFTQYDILSAPKFIGLENYRHAFVSDVLFWPSLGRTFYYAIVVIPLGLAGSLTLAMLLNQGLRGINFFRTLYFLPHLTPAVAMGILWVWLLHPTLGPVNVMLGKIGLGGFPWLTDSNTVLPSFIFITLWASMGGDAMLIFLAGLQGVPRELQESAEIDGAGVVMRFRHVTLPMITPTLFFNLILGIISALQVFTVSFVATQGGPDYGSWFFALHIYQQAFSYLRLGYGAALAWVLVVVVLLLTLVNFALSRKWVFYRGAM